MFHVKHFAKVEAHNLTSLSAALPIAATGSYRRAASFARQDDLTLFGAPCGVAQVRHDVFALQVGAVSKDFLDAMPRADLADDHAHCDPHSTNARLAAHDAGLLGNAIKPFHALLLADTGQNGRAL